VDDQLRKGYIRPSKSSQTLLVFFVGKKDGKKRIVIDYCSLNEQTIKNNYPLPLITDLIGNIGSKKVFTITVVLWTSSYILYGLPLHQKGNISKATC